MSEQLSPESAPPQEPLEFQSMGSFAEPAAVPAPSSRLKWIAPAWFFFGIIVGIVGFAAYNAVIIKPAAPAPTPVAQGEAAWTAAGAPDESARNTCTHCVQCGVTVAE